MGFFLLLLNTALFNAICGETDVSPCDTPCGASSSSTLFAGKLVSFEDSALRLAEHECGVCKLSTDPCRPPFAQIPVTTGVERIAGTNAQKDENVCCRREQADECVPSHIRQVHYYIRQIFVEILGCTYGFLGHIWLLSVSLRETMANFAFEVSVVIALLTICIIAAFRTPNIIRHRLSRTQIVQRLDAWPPHYITLERLKSEVYWPLILPPHSVKFRDSSALKTPPATPVQSGLVPDIDEKGDHEKDENDASPLGVNKKRVSSSSISSDASYDNSSSEGLRGRSPSSSSTESVPYEFDPDLDLKTYTPALFFVNTQSGGQYGWELLKTLRVLVNPAQIVDLNEKSCVKPRNVLHCFINAFGSQLRIVVAGGDGSVGWILQMLDELDDDMKILMPVYPPLAVIPYGVGNDMARVLGWLSPVVSPASVQNFLVDIMEARIVGLDRWQFKAERLKEGKRKSITTLKEEQVFNNYFGIGTDATVAKGFHVLRNIAPSICMSKVINMAHYFWIGAIEAVRRTNQSLQKNVQIICDGKEMELDEDIEGIVIGNIASFASGLRLWHETDESATTLQQDGKLDVCLLRGADHLGMFQVGLARAVNLCQASRIELVFHRTTVMHCDGEPWYQPASRIVITPSTRVTKASFLKKIGPKGLGEAQFNMVLQKALREGVADETQMAWFQKEMAVRMEHAEEKAKNQEKGFSFSNALRFF